LSASPGDDLLKLYFVRHGESTANLLREFSNSGHKHPLTDRGVEQARTVAGALRGQNITQIYTSPVLRAVQTAQILAEALQAPVEITEALREWSVGVYEGTTDPRGWELHQQVQDDWFVQGKLESKMPGGESFVEIRERFVPFIERLLQPDGDPERRFALVGHGGLYLAMLPLILKNVDLAFARREGIPYTAMVEADARPGGLTCISWAGRACPQIMGGEHAHD
jgi:probable phosphoglycerate mutase